MTRLAISSIEENVTKKEVMDLMKEYESMKVIPKNQSVQYVIDRAWYVANSNLSGFEANEKFRNENIEVKAPLVIYAGLNLTKFEAKIIKSGEKANIYVDKNGKLSVEMKIDGKKIKTNLKLPSNEVTYIRYIIDSNFIPVTGTIKKVKNSYKVMLEIG